MAPRCLLQPQIGSRLACTGTVHGAGGRCHGRPAHGAGARVSRGPSGARENALFSRLGLSAKNPAYIYLRARCNSTSDLLLSPLTVRLHASLLVVGALLVRNIFALVTCRTTSHTRNTEVLFVARTAVVYFQSRTAVCRQRITVVALPFRSRLCALPH